MELLLLLLFFFFRGGGGGRGVGGGGEESGDGRGVTTICHINEPREYSDQHPRNLNSLCKARVAKDPKIFKRTAKTDRAIM